MLTETWSISDHEFDSFLPNFSLFPLNRPPRSEFFGSGGILVGINDDAVCNMRRLSSNSNSVIWLLLTTKGQNVKILCGCLYLVPDNSNYNDKNTLSLIKSELHDHALEYSPSGIMLGGDLNARTGLLDDFDINDDDEIGSVSQNVGPRFSMDASVDARGIELIQMCKEMDLHIVNGRKGKDLNIGKFTCIKWNGRSVVDYLIVNSYLFDQITAFEVVDKLDSDHLPLDFMYFNNASHQSTCQSDVVQGQPLKPKLVWDSQLAAEYEANLAAAEATMARLEVAAHCDAGQLNDAVKILCDSVRTCGHNMARPVKFNANRKFINRNNDSPWYDEECQNQKDEVMKRLRILNRNSDVDGDINDWYRSSLKNFKDMYKNKRRIFMDSNKVELMEAIRCKDEKKFWKLFDKGWHDYSAAPVSTGQWHTYFSKLYESDCQVFDLIFHNFEYIEILDAPFSLDEVSSAVKKAKNGKSGGIDGIAAEFWKFAPCNHELLCNIYNVCLDKESYPDEWKVSVIVPVFKNKGDATCPDNYRGIALLPTAAKPFSVVVCDRLEKWAEQNGFFIPTQSGFRKGLSCLDNIFMLDTIVRKYLREGRLYSAFIDFRKAFDYVNRNILWQKLLDAGISSKMVRLLKNMYQGITACVRTNSGTVTEQFQCSLGLRQGDSLSAILFIFFVNDLQDFLVNNNCNLLNLDTMPLLLMFLADDLSLFDKSVKGLQKKFDTLAVYCKRYELVVNRAKSKVITFRKGGDLQPYEVWTYEGQPIDSVNVYTYLGVDVDYLCNWGEAKAARIRKATRAQFKVYRNLDDFGKLSADIMLKIFDSKIIPIALYGCEVWGVTDLSVFEKFCNNFYRALLKLRPNAPVTLAKGELGRNSIYVKVHIRIIKFWLNCISAEEGSARRCTYNTQLFLASKNEPCWALGVKNMLFTYGYGDIWEAQMVDSTEGFTAAFRQRLIDSDRQSWHMDVITFGSLRTYKLLKERLDYEAYLNMGLSIECQNMITRLRGGLLNIRVNSGRWLENNTLEQRTCQICNSGIIEDEYHLLFECSVWSGFRGNLNLHAEFRRKDLKSVVCTKNRRLILDLWNFLKSALQMRLDIVDILS